LAEQHKHKGRYLIVNADDFGASTGVNDGIVDCHVRGIVTSASLMVTGRAVHEAVSMSRDHPRLSVGLHWDVWGEDEYEFDIDDAAAVREAFGRQLDEFQRLMGRVPTHVDSHRHAHRYEQARPVLREAVAQLGVPLRGESDVRYIGGFYAQWEWRVTNLDHVSVLALQGILQNEVGDGWTEVSCHPGYISPDFESVYLHEREAEVRTLTDPRVRQTINALDIRLASYSDYLAREA
jgi:predicted glycoside hydrolase/deacetylase ChbG (UPF0249 family)